MHRVKQPNSACPPFSDLLYILALSYSDCNRSAIDYKISMTMWSLMLDMQKPKRRLFLWIEWCLQLLNTHNLTDYEMYQSIFITSHISDLLMKIIIQDMELKCNNKFLVLNILI